MVVAGAAVVGAAEVGAGAAVAVVFGGADVVAGVVVAAGLAQPTKITRRMERLRIRSSILDFLALFNVCLLDY